MSPRVRVNVGVNIVRQYRWLDAVDVKSYKPKLRDARLQERQEFP